MNYVHETLSALSESGVDVELWVPGPAPHDWLPKGIPIPSYQVHFLDAGYPIHGDPDRETRYHFSRMVNEAAKKRAHSPQCPDVLHLMFGLFVMEVLETSCLREAALPSVVTVHNVPPQECRQVGPDAPLSRSVKESLRLQFVGWKNRKRLRAHRYDGVIVPSEEVQKLLQPVLGNKMIDVVGHGPTRDLQAQMASPGERKPQPGEPVRLLTVGGYVPHKRQHLIPDVAIKLLEKGVNFEWKVAGPSGRVAGYYEGVQSKVDRAGLQGRIDLRGAVPFSDLAKLYDRANMYVQPSIEEGFCITALDAAASGLPVIASPAGALPDIVEISQGRLFEGNASALADAIFHFVDTDGWADAAVTSRKVQSRFSWSKAAQLLSARYEALSAADRTVVDQPA